MALYKATCETAKEKVSTSRPLLSTAGTPHPSEHIRRGDDGRRQRVGGEDAGQVVGHADGGVVVHAEGRLNEGVVVAVVRDGAGLVHAVVGREGAHHRPLVVEDEHWRGTLDVLGIEGVLGRRGSPRDGEIKISPPRCHLERHTELADGLQAAAVDCDGEGAGRAACPNVHHARTVHRQREGRAEAIICEVEHGHAQDSAVTGGVVQHVSVVGVAVVVQEVERVVLAHGHQAAGLVVEDEGVADIGRQVEDRLRSGRC